MWYVIQVMSGEEEKIAYLCRQRITKQLYENIFIPRYVRKKKYQGEWHEENRILFPGYLFVDTKEENMKEIILQLHFIDGMTKVLGDGTQAVPVAKKEQEWLKSMMDEQYIVQVSVGHIIGEQIQITSGPLSQYPAIIRKIDRHKRMAEIDIELFGRYTRVQVGLEIVKKMPVGEKGQ